MQDSVYSLNQVDIMRFQVILTIMALAQSNIVAESCNVVKNRLENYPEGKIRRPRVLHSRLKCHSVVFVSPYTINMEVPFLKLMS